MTPTKHDAHGQTWAAGNGAAGAIQSSPIVSQPAPTRKTQSTNPAQIRSVAEQLYIPPELEKQDRWVNWRYGWRDGRVTKIPVNPHTGYNAATDRPSTWGSVDDALRRYHDAPHKVSGIGYNQRGTDVGSVDLDHCVDDGGNVDAWALRWVQRFNTYTEISPSGHGIRMFGRGRKPGKREKRGNVELYDGDSTRYLTFTGKHVPGTPLTVNDVTEPLAELYAETFGADDDAAPTPAPTPAQPVNLDDAELLARAIAAKNGARFHALWSGNVSGYSSRSEADYALVGALLFWTGGDVARVDSLFRASGLMREKWDRRTGAQTYGALTIANCAAGQTKYYTPPRPRPANVTAGGVVQELPTEQDLWRILHQHVKHDGPRCSLCGGLTPWEVDTAKGTDGGYQCFRCKRQECMDWQNYRAKQLIVQQEPHTWPAHYITKLPTADYDALVDGGLLRNRGQWMAVQSPDDVMTVGSSEALNPLSIAVSLETLAVTMAKAWLDRVWLVDDDGNRKINKKGTPLRSRLRTPKNAARAKRTLACDSAKPAPVVAAVDDEPVIAKRKAAFGLIDLDPVDARTLLDIIAAEGGTVDYKRRRWSYPVELRAQIRERVAQWAAVAGLDGRKEINTFPSQDTGKVSISPPPLCEQPDYASMNDDQRHYARLTIHRDANRDSIEREVWQM